MSTVVSYKGESIVSFKSTSKTLTTAGKYCEDDITVTDVNDPVLQSTSVTYTPTTSQQTDLVAPDPGYDGIATVSVTVNAVATGTAGTPSATKGTVSSHSVSVTPSVTNTTGYITGGTKTGTAVTVSASELVSGTKSISANGTGIDVTNYAAVDVAVPAPAPTLQSKTNISPTTSSQTITYDAGYDGLSSVQINAMPSGSATTPATTVTANPSISVSSGGLITATASATKSVTPTVSAGYVSSGTAGTITISGSNTSQLTTQGATTYTPTTTNQTIASGKYLTGAQTILGDANLLAENIAKDVTIFGVTGTHEGGGGSVQTATVTLSNNYAGNIYYTDENFTMQTVTSGSLTGVTAVVGTLLVALGAREPNPFPDPEIGVVLVASHSQTYPYYIYKVTG